MVFVYILCFEMDVLYKFVGVIGKMVLFYLNKVYFILGGLEVNESVLKLVR